MTTLQLREATLTLLCDMVEYLNAENEDNPFWERQTLVSLLETMVQRQAQRLGLTEPICKQINDAAYQDYKAQKEANE